jgi:glucokinase
MSVREAAADALVVDPTADGRDVVVGVDIGGTKVAALVVDAAGVVRGSHADDLPAGDPAVAVDHVGSVVQSALEGASVGIDRVVMLGVGVPGRVDPVRGIVRHAVNLGWVEFSLGDALTASLGLPTVIENDVRAAALGLARRRIVDQADFAYVAVGTGISAGVILGGELHRGVRGLAGEIGHVVVEPDGPRCACGQRGCLEALASGPAIARRTVEAIADGAPSRLSGRGDITAVDVYEAAAAGDEAALRITEDVGRLLARAAFMLAATYDIEHVVLGGGVSHAGPTFARPVRGALAEIRASSPLAAELLTPRALTILPPGADPGVWGAITIARGALDRAPTEEVVARKRLG